MSDAPEPAGYLPLGIAPANFPEGHIARFLETAC